ncbi:hypothetical protein A4X13_0g918 [Tilletia indica]|uniref:Uncharacterized protein n=1 Tax=Tilletia indica TaxID=43049 RepID=A0A177TGB3_9BASI|nr:hypothetical protein A4X13_0g918 [Tilletia indica]
MPATDFEVALSLPDGSLVPQHVTKPTMRSSISLAALPNSLGKLRISKLRIASVSLPVGTMPTITLRRIVPAPTESIPSRDLDFNIDLARSNKHARRGKGQRSASSSFAQVYINGQAAVIRPQHWRATRDHNVAQWLAKAVAPPQAYPDSPPPRTSSATSRAQTAIRKSIDLTANAFRGIAPNSNPKMNRIRGLTTQTTEFTLVAANSPLYSDSSLSFQEPIRSFTLVLLKPRWSALGPVKRLDAVFHYTMVGNSSQPLDAQRTLADPVSVLKATTASVRERLRRGRGHIATVKQAVVSTTPRLSSIFGRRRSENKTVALISIVQSQTPEMEEPLISVVESPALVSDEVFSFHSTISGEGDPESLTPLSEASLRTVSPPESLSSLRGERSMDIPRKPVPRTKSIQDLAIEEHRRHHASSVPLIIISCD